MTIFRALCFVLGILGLFSATASAGHIVVDERIVQWPAGSQWPGTVVHVTQVQRVGMAEQSGSKQLQLFPRQALPKLRPKMLVVNRISTWVDSPDGSGSGFGRLRITVPIRYYLASWDVKALERELERLGIKVKPRPVPPKSTAIFSG